jgi:hypothetical protein
MGFQRRLNIPLVKAGVNTPAAKCPVYLTARLAAWLGLKRGFPRSGENRSWSAATGFPR